MAKLLNISGDAKTVKGEKSGFLTGILYLTPSDASHIRDVCPWASPGCKMACLHTAGRGAMSSVARGRLRKTALLYSNPAEFENQMHADIRALIRKAARTGKVPCVRLDGTSDLGTAIRFSRWYPNVQFYDYTKSFKRYEGWLASPRGNRHLTLSFTETTPWERYADILSRGGTVAVVFATKRKESLPSSFRGFPVIDGDLDDVRFRDPAGVVVGLRAKGKAKNDRTGFVVRGE